MQELKLILVDPKPAMCEAWHTHFDGFSNVEIVNGYFEKLPDFDCMVSAANSFGLMDGGVDLAIIRFFGRSLEQCVQQHILEHYLGEQPIGTSFIIETAHEKHPFVAHTPTMRVPMGIALTDQVYVAMWAMLLAVNHHNLSEPLKIKTIACPGLGTATGQVPFAEAARQMALAYQYFLNPPTYIGWHYADERQRKVGRGGDMGFLLAAAMNKKKGDD
jgi:O-acetyl-ADP-ribose deacetylase (regulator of RNase III)